MVFRFGVNNWGKIYLTESKESGIKQMDNVIKYFEFIESKSIALYFQKRLNELID
ncbi:hypothetical protein RLL51_02540 [Streptococcus pneumoniae]|nr:hypothetical protein [Streptococcus pneumoniae]MDT5977727.1 hypothetical protein [Streptococcus pneumoniae]VMD63259.1 putative transcriptional regulator [Streptococcus pneumoniae]VPG36297.1 putative transcriptional regulator [Streptococcus pneumoniae]VSI85077.1 putative transcriptional regulator [Streptococcus pneumoniae]